jgi:hypothetical protein
VTQEGFRNVGLVKDDLFASELEPSSFDLVHSRFEITPPRSPPSGGSCVAAGVVEHSDYRTDLWHR